MEELDFFSCRARFTNKHPGRTVKSVLVAAPLIKDYLVILYEEGLH